VTLVDTSVWIGHFGKPIPELIDLLEAKQVVMHPMVFGELSLSPFKGYDQRLALGRLSLLENLPASEHEDVMALVERCRLGGRGIGWVDCHLLAAAREAHCHLLTRDKALKAAWLSVRPRD
jgi:predicted nucleic acid-binding protein